VDFRVPRLSRRHVVARPGIAVTGFVLWIVRATRFLSVIAWAGCDPLANSLKLTMVVTALS